MKNYNALLKRERQSDEVQIRENFRDIRATDTTPRDGIAGIVSGYSSTFWTVDSYLTAMHPDAFTRTLADRSEVIPFLYQHIPEINFGIPVVQQVDQKGLRLEAEIIDDGDEGTKTMRRLRAGARFGFSFGFRLMNMRPATEDDPLDFTFFPNVNRTEVMVYTEVKLYEHSLVTFPANENAAVDDIRRRATADALDMVLRDAEAGRLTDGERSIVEQILAAVPSGTSGSSDSTLARTTRDLDLDLMIARLRNAELLGIGA